MNIVDFMPNIQVLEGQLCNHAELVLSLRERTFKAFCATEKDKGGIDSSYPLFTTQGQNNVRQLFARMVEELFESDESESREHRLEELIDALNFGLSLVFLGDWLTVEQDHWQELLLSAMKVAPVKYLNENSEFSFPSQLYRLGLAFSPLLAKLRNRTWQNSSQHPYFSGNLELINAVAHLYGMVVCNFKDMEEFLAYYIAKDQVLQFRINSRY